MASTTVCIGALVAFACRMPATPAVAAGEEGEVCKIGDHVVKQCREPLMCVQSLSVPEQVPGRQLPTAPPGMASGAGGLCGGSAHIQCASGLACYLTSEQQNMADAMGTCDHASWCRR